MSITNDCTVLSKFKVRQEPSSPTVFYMTSLPFCFQIFTCQNRQERVAKMQPERVLDHDNIFGKDYGALSFVNIDSNI